MILGLGISEAVQPGWTVLDRDLSVKIIDGGLHFLFSLFTLFYFFFFFFSFLFLEQLRLGFISYAVIAVMSDGVVTKLIMELERME